MTRFRYGFPIAQLLEHCSADRRLSDGAPSELADFSLSFVALQSGSSAVLFLLMSCSPGPFVSLIMCLRPGLPSDHATSLFIGVLLHFDLDTPRLRPK